MTHLSPEDLAKEREASLARRDKRGSEDLERIRWMMAERPRRDFRGYIIVEDDEEAESWPPVSREGER